MRKGKIIIEESGKVSIIIPVYNCIKDLSNCIESILCQSYNSIEIILIDDGSTDGSSVLCDEFALRDNRVIAVHQKNSGASNARNRGIDYAMGEFIYFCDGDDLLLPGAILKMVTLLKMHHADMCVCGYTRNSEYANDDKNATTFLRNRNDAMELISINEDYGGFIWNKMFLKKNIENLRFDSDIKFCEDQLFCLRYMEKTEKFVFSSSKVYFYRDNPNGTCNNCSINHLLDFTFSIYDCAVILRRNNVNLQTVLHMMDRVQQMSTQIFIGTFKIKNNRSLFQKKLVYVFGKSRQYHKAKVKGTICNINMRIMCLLFKLGWTQPDIII